MLERDVEPIGGTWPSPALNGQGLPIELVDRARQLLGEASNLEARLKAKQDALEVSRSPSPRPRHLPPRSTRSTDL